MPVEYYGIPVGMKIDQDPESSVLRGITVAVRRKKQAPPSKYIIELSNVTKIYKDASSAQAGGQHALHGVNIKIEPGEFVFIVGESGSGKSTLIKLLMRELVATEGNIKVMDYDLNRIRHRKIPKFRRNVGIVFQNFRLLPDRNVYENVAFAQRIIQKSGKEIRRNVPAVLARVGLAGKYKAKIRHLTGGEQQRVAIARALVNKPSILLCDEPTGNLDPKTTWEIMKLLENINAQGTTVIVVTHNADIVNSMQKRVITLEKGVVVSDEENGGYIDED